MVFFVFVVCVRFFFQWAVISTGGESHGSSTDG
jgi:hypothetical protein